MKFTDAQLALKAIAYRRRILEIIKHAGAGHTGGSLSCVDILNVLYNRILSVSPETFGDPRRSPEPDDGGSRETSSQGHDRRSRNRRALNGNQRAGADAAGGTVSTSLPL